MKKEYRRPEVAEYGHIHQLTFGATGSDGDFIIRVVAGRIVVSPDPTNPNCQTNVPSGFCYH